MPVFQNTFIIERKPEAIFDIITDASYWTDWYKDTKKVEGDFSGPMKVGNTIHETIKMPFGIGVVTWKCVERIFPESFKIAGGGMGGEGAITYKFRGIDGRTEFTRILDFAYTKGILRYLQYFAVPGVKRKQAKAMLVLKKKAEQLSDS
ncbi:MAG: SRPBCC family protein [Spirochaetales bacterium]|nr:SRPBCC family protein [Spirochaetales bacterium]